MLSNNPGPMIRCTSMAAPMTSPESLSALANSGCMLLVSSWNRRKRRKQRIREGNRIAISLTPGTVTEPRFERRRTFFLLHSHSSHSDTVRNSVVYCFARREAKSEPGAGDEDCDLKAGEGHNAQILAHEQDPARNWLGQKDRGISRLKKLRHEPGRLRHETGLPFEMSCAAPCTIGFT